MNESEFVKKAINLIFATDAEGYPLPAHTKIANLQILTNKYLKKDK